MAGIFTALRRSPLTLVMVASLILAVALGGCSSQPKAFTIGIVNLPPTLDPMVDGFKAGMAELGYTEGENVTYIYEGATSSFEGLDPAIQHLIEQDVDLIFTITTPAALKTRLAVEGTDIPVVFGAVTTPVERGVVESLIHPGGNLTGIDSGGFVPKQAEWLLAMAPDTEHLFVPHNPDDATSVRALADLKAAVATLGVELVIVEVRTVDELFTALDAPPEDVDAVFVLSSGFLTAHLNKFIETAIERKLPLTTVGEGAQRGALTSYGHDIVRVGAQASRLADKVLQGTSPADLPVEKADFFLSINLQTANAIGLEISDEILAQAHNISR